MAANIDKTYGSVKQKDVNRAHNQIRDTLNLLFELREMTVEDSQTDVYLSKIIVPLAEAEDCFLKHCRNRR